MHGSTMVVVGLQELGVAHARRWVVAMGEGGECEKDGEGRDDVCGTQRP